MNKGTAIAFFAGLLLGRAVAYRFAEKKYERIANKEIESVKETFKRNMQKIRDETIVQNNKEKFDTENDWNDAFKCETNPDYERRVNNLGYLKYSDNEKEEREMIVPKPYIIPPEKFGEIDDYDEITLTYYADKILTDEDDDIVEDIEDAIGEDSLEQFGVYEECAVYVRNETRQCDFEILLDEREYYADVAPKYNRYGDLY